MNSDNDFLIRPLEASKRLISNIETLNNENFKQLKQELDNNFDTIKKNYDKLNVISTPIEYNEYLRGLIKSVNTEKSLCNILVCIQNLATHTLDAFKANNKNLKAILDLLKISVDIENDLYKQLDDSNCSKESIANLLHDLCSQYQIDNHDIENLFEQSFKRTITLRNRINELRQEIYLRISTYEEKFKNLDEIIKKKEDDFVRKFDDKTTEYNKQLETRIKEYSTEIGKFNEELQSVRNSYKLEFKSIKDSLIDYIQKYNTEISEQHNLRLEQYEREIIGFQEQIKEQDAKIEEYRNETEDRLSKELLESQSKYVTSEEFESLLKRYQNLENKVCKKSFFDSIWYKGTIGIIALSALAISIFAAF